MTTCRFGQCLSMRYSWACISRDSSFFGTQIEHVHAVRTVALQLQQSLLADIQKHRHRHALLEQALKAISDVPMLMQR